MKKVICSFIFLCAISICSTALAANLAILPVVTGTDNLSGASQTSWTFTGTTTAELSVGDAIQFVFPSGFNLDNLAITATSGLWFYHTPETVGSNLLSNSSFENSTTSWNINDEASSAFSTSTNAAYDGDVSLRVVDSTFAYPLGITASTSTTPDTRYTLSYYAKGNSGGETVRVLAYSFITTCAEGELGIYNFISQDWDCLALGPGLIASTSPYVASSTVGTSFSRYTTSFDSPADTSNPAFVFSIGDTDETYDGQIYYLDAVQLEEGPNATAYNQGETISPVAGLAQSGLVAATFATTTIPTGTTFSVTFSSINNPSATVNQDITFIVRGGTPSVAGNATSSLNTEKFSLVADATLLGSLVETVQTGHSSGYVNLVRAKPVVVSPISTNTLTKAFKYGQSSREVKILQTKLQARGFLKKSLKTTNYFGVLTKTALIKFQKANKIKPANGTLNVQTRALLNK